MLDEIASDRALSFYGLPRCLHVPIAALDEGAIATYVGDIVRVVSRSTSRRAFLVRAHARLMADEIYPIWGHPGASVLTEELQVWVHIGYGSYRAAYRRAFPDMALGELVLSHAMNRRVAALKGFDFVRITPTSRRANSSSAFSEGWGVTLHGSVDQMAANKRLGASVQYADLTELMLMLDISLGGGMMEAVNSGQALIRPRPD